MTDDRPSLRDMRAWRKATAQYQARTGTPEPVDALLEIAEAAFALGHELVYLRGPLSERLREALAKVRP